MRGQSGQSEPVTCSCHATAVAAGGRGLLITGPSGSGKSTLALDMMALGADLISDDRVVLARCGQGIVASAPKGVPPLIEARGIGLIPVAAMAPPTLLSLIIDLGVAEADRLPPVRVDSLLGVEIRSLRKPARLIPSAILLTLKAGGVIDPDSVDVSTVRALKQN